MEKKKKKYLLLYLKTGGGHLAPARAIHKYLNEKYSDAVDSQLIYGFEEAPGWVRYIIEDGYRILQYKGKWFFEFLYALNKFSLFGELSCRSVSSYIKPYLEKTILKEKPDKIVIFHFFLIHPLFKILKQNKLNIPVITLITDPFTPHPMWFLKKKQNFLAFSNGLYNRIRKKYPKSLVSQFQFVLDEKYSTTLNKEEINEVKNKYGYSPDKKIVLVLGGGDGIPKGEKILEEMLLKERDYQIAMVCGKNIELLKKAENIKRRFSADNLEIYGFVDFIYELLNISDVVITKCGASTIMEILTLQKIPIVNDYIWEQEKGNVNFLRDNKLGIYEPYIKKLPLIVNKLLGDASSYNDFLQNIKNEQIKNGLAEVVQHILA